MFKRIACVMTLFATALCGLVYATAPADGQPEKGAKADIMKLKLASAQKLLEGLAVRDFDIIEKNADNLLILSKKVEWMVLQTPDYTRHSNDFRRQAENLSKAAKEKNLDAAALGYVQMTLTCVNCHKHVREVRMAFKDE